VNVYDPGYLNGWGKRGFSWLASARIDQQLRPGLGVTVGYYRTWYGNFLVTDNLLVGPENFSPYCITAPTDDRLGSVSGNQICGLYDIDPLLFGQTQNFITSASKFGKQTERYNGVDMSINARFAHGGLVQGGINIGNQNIAPVNASTGTAGATAGTAIAHANTCFVVDSPQQLYQCDVKPGYVTQVKVLASYALPGDVRASVNFQSLPGPVLAAAYPASTAEIASSLGRPLAGGTRSVNIQLLTPFSQLGPRITQTDIRLAKSFKIGKAKLQGMFDVYNLTNSSVVLQNNVNWGTSWLQPIVVLNGRLAKVGAQLEF
jgi:hypothetical protein